MSGEFDFIMFHHSLEHVSDPDQSLDTRGSYLRLAAAFWSASQLRARMHGWSTARIGYSWMRRATL